MSKQVKTGLFRAAFVNVYKPKRNEQSGKDEWGLVMLFPKSNPEALEPFRAAALEALTEKWGQDKSKWPAKLRNLDLKKHLSPGGDGWPIRDGDMQDYDGFEGNVSIGAKSYDPFGVVDNMRTPIEGEALRKVQSGLICRAAVTASAYDQSGNRGVSFWCNALQVCKDDGTRFGGRVNAATAFDEFDDEDGADDAGNYKATGTSDF